MDKDGGLAKASEKMEANGTKGSFTKEAKHAGKSVAEFAKKERHSKNPKMKKRAVFAANAQKHFKG